VAGKQVKTYRVTHGEGLKVGDSVRQFGELIPEASNWPNTNMYLAAHHIEVAFVDQSEIDEFMKKVNKKPKAKKEPEDGTTPKKRVTKKTTTKKKIKKGVKKNGLAESSV
jgi:hypothetical protein